MIDEEDRAWNAPRKNTKESRNGFLSTLTGRHHNPSRPVHDRVSDVPYSLAFLDLDLTVLLFGSRRC